MTAPEESRQERFILAGPPPAWILPGSDEPIPQPIVELAAIHTDLASAGLATGQWLDTPWWLDWAKAKALGFVGVNRYMCADYNTGPGSSLPQKRVVYDELQQILAAGLDFSWNYEDAAGDFNKGYTTWKARGQHAADYAANTLKLPAGVACFASCDMDVGLQMTTTQLESQHGFHDGYQHGPAGIYGSTVAINNTAKAGTSSFGWLTLAKSWNHNVSSPLVHLDQVGSAFNGSADTNNVLQQPFGSYLQVIDGGTDLTPDEHQWLLDLHNWLQATPPFGQKNLGGTISATLGTTQNIYNKLNQVGAQVVALPSADEIADAVVAKLPPNPSGTGPTLDQINQAIRDALNATHLATP